MDETYTQIFNTLQYAKDNNINPADPNTWDENYRRRQMELAGIISEVAQGINSMIEGIEIHRTNNRGLA